MGVITPFTFHAAPISYINPTSSHLPLQIHPALPPSSATPHLCSEASFVIHTHTHTPFQPIFDPAFHTHPAHLPLPASTSEALASPPSTHSPSFSSRQASRNSKGLAWIMPMTKRAAGVSWLWPSSRPCFEHSFSVRACALSRNSRTFAESKSRRKLANRKLVYALKRPRREAQKKSTSYLKKAQKTQKKTQKKTQTTNHDHKKSTNKAQTTNHDHKKKHKKSTKQAQTTNHDHKKSTKKHKKAQTTNHDHKKNTKSTKKKHKLPITTTKKNTKKAQTTNHDHKQKHKILHFGAQFFPPSRALFFRSQSRSTKPEETAPRPEAA